jgi:hypothetical protein
VRVGGRGHYHRPPPRAVAVVVIVVVIVVAGATRTSRCGLLALSPRPGGRRSHRDLLGAGLPLGSRLPLAVVGLGERKLALELLTFEVSGSQLSCEDCCVWLMSRLRGGHVIPCAIICIASRRSALGVSAAGHLGSKRMEQLAARGWRGR